jgi:hypothetical protein
MKRFAVTALLCVFSALAAAQSTAVQPLMQPYHTFTDSSGAPCAGCSLYTYAAGTTTPLATYTDATGTVQNANPIILDTAGGATIWPATSLSYKYVLKDTFGTTVFTTDRVSGQALAAYLPLVGGILTGAISGTSASFSGTVAAGVLSAPLLGKVVLVDGYVSGTNGGAWNPATTYAPCSVVTATATVNDPPYFVAGHTYTFASTIMTTNVVPGTGDTAHSGAHAYDWLLVRSDGVTYVPSGAECADIIAIGNGERVTIGTGSNVGQSYTLNFGSGYYPIVNALFVSDPAPMFNGAPYDTRVAISFVGQGSHSTHITQAGNLPVYSTTDGTMATLPTSIPTATLYQPTMANASSISGPYAISTFAISGIDVNAVFTAPYAVDLIGFSANTHIYDLQYEAGTVGQARFGLTGYPDAYMSSPTMQGITDYTQSQGSTNAYLTASLSGGVPHVGFGVMLNNITRGASYPNSGSGTCTVNGGTSSAAATCTIVADGYGGALIALSSPGTYSVVPTSVTANFNASFTAAIAGTTMTVSAVSAGTLVVGQSVTGTGVTGGTVISALGTGTGGTGTYTVNNSQTVGSESMTAAAGSGASATPFISAGTGYGPNTQIVLQGTQGGTSLTPCSTMPAASSFTPSRSSVPVYLYPQGSITPTISSGTITLTGWETATGASGCVGPVEVWASDMGAHPVVNGTDFSYVTDAAHLGGLFGTSGNVCTFNFPHSGNSIFGIHYQSQGRYGVCNTGGNIFHGVDSGEQYEGAFYSTVPYTVDGANVFYSIPFQYYAFSTQTSFAAASSGGATVKNVMCGGGPARSTPEYNSLVLYSNNSVVLSAGFNHGTGYPTSGPTGVTCTVNGGNPVLYGQAVCSVAPDGLGGIIPHIDNAGAYSPGSATPTISMVGGTNTATATVALLSPATIVLNGPGNALSTDVDNVNYCGPFTTPNTGKIASKAASIALNGVNTPINQNVDTSKIGFLGTVGIPQTIVQRSVSNNGDGVNSINWTLTANTASNEALVHGNYQIWTNNLTGGGHITNFWANPTGIATESGTTIDVGRDYFVDDTGLDNNGTITTRRAIGCNLLRGTTITCFYDRSGGGLDTNGPISAAGGAFAVDKNTGAVTSPNGLTTAGNQTLTAANTVSGLPTGCQQLPCTVGAKSFTALTGALNPTTLFSTGGSYAGFYRMCTYTIIISTTETSGTIGTSYTTSVGWSGSSDSHTMYTQNANATGTAQGGICNTFYAGASSNIQVFGNFSGAGGAISWNAYATVELVKLGLP